MAKKIGSYPIPFNSRGDQLHYEDYGCQTRPNEPFHDTLEYESYSRGRSAAYLVFRRQSNGTAVVVFMTDMDDMMPHLVNGKITGRFQHIKRGQNFGTTLLEGK